MNVFFESTDYKLRGASMKYFCLWDFINDVRKKRGESSDDMVSFFRNHGITKNMLSSCKEQCALDSIPEIVQAVQEYASMNYLELCLSLGIIPEQYAESFASHIPQIAKMLTCAHDSVNEQKVSLSPFFSTASGTLYNANCLEVMKTIASESVDLVFADPPFNLSKVYDEGIDDCKSTSDYISWCHQWLSECIRILKPGGSLFVYNIPKWAMYFSEYLNKRITFRSWISIDMKFSLPLCGRLNPTHYALLYYVKGAKPNTFNNPRIPIQTCRHCGGEIKDYGGYKAKMNPLGVNVSDVWTDIYPVRHKNTKNRAYNELSIKMLDRVISMATNPGDTVFDPFGGSGTTYIVAEMLGRKWIGCELGNCNIISDRFTNIEKDRVLLTKVEHEKNILFPEAVRKLRAKNGFWLCDDFACTSNSHQEDTFQISFIDSMNDE